MTTQTKEQVITVGTPVTGCYFADLYPMEVVRVTPSGKTIEVREMTATPAEGYDYFTNQKYTYESNENGQVYTARLTKRGFKTKCGMRFSVGNARKYQDPHY